MKRDDLRTFRFADSPIPEIEDGEALLAIDRFSLTANNILYALFGDPVVFPESDSGPERALPSYWDFFPAEDGWGRIPVWGFADVVTSAAEALAEGARVYGYLPPSNHLVVTPSAAGSWGFMDSSPHRRALPAIYNAYLHAQSDPLYSPRFEDQLALLRTLFVTSFLIHDYLEDNDFFDAEAIVLSSASSKTALAAAFLLAQHDGPKVVGLTSARNVGFVERTGVYQVVADYEEVGSGEKVPAVYVDFSGDAEVRAAVHGHYGEALKRSLSVGATHWDRIGSETETTTLFDPERLTGPRPEFFFAGDRIVARTTDWGARSLWGRIAEAWRPYVEWSERWLELVRGSGQSAIGQAYLELIDGRVNPATGHVLTPGNR